MTLRPAATGHPRVRVRAEGAAEAAAEALQPPDPSGGAADPVSVALLRRGPRVLRHLEDPPEGESGRQRLGARQGQRHGQYPSAQTWDPAVSEQISAAQVVIVGSRNSIKHYNGFIKGNACLRDAILFL